MAESVSSRLLARLPQIRRPSNGDHAWTPTWHTVDRLRDDYPLRHDNRLSWFVTIALALLAFGIRFPGLANPAKIVFDETYYAKEAWSVLHFGYARAWPSNADAMIAQGQINGWLSTPDMVVHPQMAKYLIAVGEWLFGMNSFGWRFASVIFGCLLVAATVRMARRLSRSTLVGALAGFLLCVDGLDYVMSRIALLDIFQATFTVMAVAAALADRDWFRNRLARYIESNNLTSLNGKYGPLLWWRPWRLASGVLFGLACGCKWNSMYVLAVVGIACVVFDFRARSTAGARDQAGKSVLRDGIMAFIMMVVVAAIVYTATWAGWLATSGGYDRQWGAQNPGSLSVRLVGKPLASLWHYNVDIWDYHTGTWITEQTHPYNANPAGWLVVARTIGIEYTGPIPPGTPGCPSTATKPCTQTWDNNDGTTNTWLQAPGTPGCPADTKGSCMTIITGLGTPFLWWFAAIAIVASLVFWLFGRDWRFAVPTVAWMSTWIGWWISSDRPVFFFYAIMMIPFTATLLAMCMGKIIGPPGGTNRRRNSIIVGAAVVLITLNFAFILPILNDTVMPTWAWQLRMWFPGWV